MAVYSGKNGKVKLGQTELADVTKWSASRKSNVTTFGTSSSGGWKKACAGTDELTGDLEAKLQDDASAEPIGVGTLVDLELSTGEHKWSGSAMITEMAYEVDIDSGAPVGFKASFVSNGAWTFAKIAQ